MCSVHLRHTYLHTKRKKRYWFCVKAFESDHCQPQETISIHGADKYIYLPGQPFFKSNINDEVQYLYPLSPYTPISLKVIARVPSKKISHSRSLILRDWTAIHKTWLSQAMQWGSCQGWWESQPSCDSPAHVSPETCRQCNSRQRWRLCFQYWCSGLQRWHQ